MLFQNNPGTGHALFTIDPAALVTCMKVIRPDNAVADRAAEKAFLADISITKTAALVNMLPAERLFADTAGYRVPGTEPGGAD
jgi:hypothetical protein